MTEDYELVIGSRRLSSWSLRPWLLLRMLGIPFREVLIPLRTPESKPAILRHSPAGKVPVLKAGGLAVWDSLAICEFIADAHPGKAVWPVSQEARAVARSVSAEMHSGFAALREELPMDFLTVHPFPAASEQARADIRRIVAIWQDCRTRFGTGGDFLFGTFSAADAMYAPVASRFHSYSVDLAAFGDDGTAARYRDVMMSLPGMAEWGELAKSEPSINPQ